MQRARALGERIRAQIDDIVSVTAENGQLIRFNVSIGLTALDPADTDFAQLLSRADRALYAAKGGGRNRVEEA